MRTPNTSRWLQHECRFRYNAVNVLEYLLVLFRNHFKLVMFWVMVECGFDDRGAAPALRSIPNCWRHSGNCWSKAHAKVFKASHTDDGYIWSGNAEAKQGEACLPVYKKVVACSCWNSTTTFRHISSFLQQLQSIVPQKKWHILNHIDILTSPFWPDLIWSLNISDLIAGARAQAVSTAQSRHRQSLAKARHGETWRDTFGKFVHWDTFIKCECCECGSRWQ